MNSKNCETMCIAPTTSYGGFRKGFTKKQFESHITKIFMDVTHEKLKKSPNFYKMTPKFQKWILRKL